MLKALLVMPLKAATWTRTTTLPFPPFPGLGIRIDVYDVLNVDSVVIGDPGYDVTCFVQLESAPADAGMLEKKCEALGFEITPYP